MFGIANPLFQDLIVRDGHPVGIVAGTVECVSYGVWSVEDIEGNRRQVRAADGPPPRCWEEVPVSDDDLPVVLLGQGDYRRAWP